MVGLSDSFMNPINRRSFNISFIIFPITRDLMSGLGSILGHKVTLGIRADLDITASLISRRVLKERSDDLGSVLVN